MKLTLQNILHLYRFYNSFIYLFCKVYEFRAPIAWNKGHAVQYIQGKLGVEDPFSIYIGDDQTDEDAFQVFFLNNMCHSMIFYIISLICLYNLGSP